MNFITEITLMHCRPILICCRFCARWKRRTSFSVVSQCHTLAACCSLERQLAVSDQWNFHWPFLVNGLTIRHTVQP